MNCQPRATYRGPALRAVDARRDSTLGRRGSVRRFAASAATQHERSINFNDVTSETLARWDADEP